MKTPAPAGAAVPLGIGVPFKAFKNVEGLHAEFGGSFGGGDGTNSAATKQYDLFPWRYSCLDPVIEFGV